MGFGLVQGHGGANESLQRFLVYLLALVEVDGAPCVPLKTGVEEARRIEGLLQVAVNPIQRCTKRGERIGLLAAGAKQHGVPACPLGRVAHVMGHVLDAQGRPVKPGELGQIAVKRPDPVMFLEYWGQPEATREKFIGDWMTTGDQGVVDDDGYFSFVGRDDDVITSSGYRIGPGEIEDCLIKHPAVALAAVGGKPDTVRTEIVKAFIVLKPGQNASPKLADDIQAFVRTRLSAHEYPREIAFIDEMPMTTTGKVIRRLLRARA